MKFQLKHFGISIPKEQQPTCSHCGGYMAIHRIDCNGRCDMFWACLDCECEGPLEQAQDFPFEKWLGWEVVTPGHMLLRERARRAGYSDNYGIDEAGQLWECIDAPAWGGNHVASESSPDSSLRWTGYNGQVAEEWRLVKDLDVRNG